MLIHSELLTKSAHSMRDNVSSGWNTLLFTNQIKQNQEQRHNELDVAAGARIKCASISMCTLLFEIICFDI